MGILSRRTSGAAIVPGQTRRMILSNVTCRMQILPTEESRNPIVFDHASRMRLERSYLTQIPRSTDSRMINHKLSMKNLSFIR